MGFFDIILGFPTILYTVPLGLALLYWLFVIVGALDIDLISLDGVDGALDGAAEGALEGVAEGADAIGHGGGLASLLSALNLGKVPLTISFSFIIFFGWIASYIGASVVGSAVPAGTAHTLLDVAVMLLAGVLGVAVTSQAVRPLAPAFHTHQAASRDASVGKLCTIRTGSVTETFGQAEVADGGAGLLLEVRAPEGNGLKRGDQALIYDYDAERELFLVEPLAPLEGAHRVGDDEMARLEAELARVEREGEKA
jgi:hypothetical protein